MLLLLIWLEAHFMQVLHEHFINTFEKHLIKFLCLNHLPLQVLEKIIKCAKCCLNDVNKAPLSECTHRACILMKQHSAT